MGTFPTKKLKTHLRQMNAIPCTPRHEKQDDTFLPVEKTFQPVLWLHCPNELFDLIGARVGGAATADGAPTHMGQRASEAGSEEKDD